MEDRVIISSELRLFPGAPSGFSCAAASAKILGVPTCVYGFITYLIIGILSILALKSK